MKIIERITLTLFSTLMLILSIIFCLLIFGWLDISFIGGIMAGILSDTVSSNILLGLSIVFILLSLRGIFFDSGNKKQEELKNGVLLENADGKLFITKETIENLVEAVTKQYKMAKDVSSKVELDKDNNVNIFVNLVVGSDTVIKDLSKDLQDKIKSKVKETTDLEVKQVNITVKKAVQEKQKTEA